MPPSHLVQVATSCRFDQAVLCFVLVALRTRTHLGDILNAGSFARPILDKGAQNTQEPYKKKLSPKLNPPGSSTPPAYWLGFKALGLFGFCDVGVLRV